MKNLLTIISMILLAAQLMAQNDIIKIELNRDACDELTHLLKSESLSIKGIKAGDFVSNSTCFSLALGDRNQNGMYNEIHTDFIAIGRKDAKYFPVIKTISSQNLQAVNYLKSDSLYFKVEEIDPNGKYICISKCSKQQNNCIKKFDKLPKLDYTDIRGKTQPLDKLIIPNRYIYIEIWWEACSPCVQNLPLLNELSQKYKNSVTILNLLDKANLDDLKRLTKQYNLNLMQGLSNWQINSELILYGYPHGLLFDPQGNLMEFKMSVKELEEFLINLK